MGSNAPTSVSVLEPGSFRDRNNRVFYTENQVFRALSEHAFQQWLKMWDTQFFQQSMKQGKIVQTQQVGNLEVLDPEIVQNWSAILWHQTIPFISYPYEWCFSMLKDAALLQLELLQAALNEKMVLKDSSAYNIQWVGAKPVFIDTTSFETLQPGEPWVGYRQFCQMFLYPLMLQAYKDIPFQPWMRGHLDGIDPVECNKIMNRRDLFRPGVFFHVYMQARLESLVDQKKARKSDLISAGFSGQMIQANALRLEQIIERMEWKKPKSEWSDYAGNNTYNRDEHQAKADFIREVVRGRRWKTVWDLGCNTGTFSRIAAENADSVVAMDADPLVIERFYTALKNEGNRTILPLISNLADPSPNLGWRGMERKSMPERGRPQLTLCLALIHHVVISANIPLKEFIQWLAELKTALVIEFVTKNDPMVQLLLQNKTDIYGDYTLDYFELCLTQAFQIEQTTVLQADKRILYYATPRATLG